MYYKNNFVKSQFGFKSQLKNDKKCSGTKKDTAFSEKCLPHKPNDQAKVTHSDCDSFELAVVGNDLAVPVIDANVVLAEIEVAANVEAHIKLPTPAKEIKNIRKNFYLTQCKAVPSLRGPEFVSLFITGYIHKNIQYSDDSGFIRDYSVDVPVSCTQTVALVNPTDVAFTSIKNTLLERRELAKDKHGADRCVHSQFNFENFNEPIKCKLLTAAINEVDLLKDFDKYGRFNKITEKMEVFLIVKLLQTQQVELDDNNDNNDVVGLSTKERCEQLKNRFQ